jgi:hypothetical protein
MSFTKQIKISWNIDDVQSVSPHLSEEQASDVLDFLFENHDANIGINWDVIESAVDTLFPES